MKDGQQKRLGRRYQLSIPIRVRMTDADGKEHEDIRDVLNVSATGAYFVSRLPYRINQEVNVNLPLPRKMRLVPTADAVFRCKARVVRMEADPPGYPGMFGIAVHFLIYRGSSGIR